MDWERKVAAHLMKLGESGYWHTFESPLIMLWHLEGIEPQEIAKKLVELRKK